MTLRELAWMAEARQREAWGRTSAVVAMVFNVNRGKNTPAKSADEFNPFVVRAAPKMTVKEWMRMQGATATTKANAAPGEASEGATG